MGLIDGISDFLFGSQPQSYTPQAYGGLSSPQQYQSRPLPQYSAPQAFQSAPAWNTNPAYTGLVNQQKNILGQEFSNASQGKPLLPDYYTSAVMGQAQRQAGYARDQANQNVNEQLNGMNLLGSSAQGRALGLNNDEYQREMGQARDQISQQEFGQFQNMMSQNQSLAALVAQQQQAQNAYAAQQSAQQNAYNLSTAGLQNEFNLGAFKAGSADQLAGYGAVNNQAANAYASQLGLSQDQAARNAGLYGLVGQSIGYLNAPNWGARPNSDGSRPSNASGLLGTLGGIASGIGSFFGL